MDERDAIRRSYDALAETYAAGRSADDRDVEILATFLDGLAADARVLDAGCGQGMPVLRQIQTSAIGYGLDFSRAQLELAAEHVPDAPLLQGDVTHLPLGDDVIDAIVAYHTLIHVLAGEQEAVIAEFSRVLRPGGRLLLTEGPAAWSGTNPDWLDTGVEMRWDIAGVKTTRTQLEQAGFTIDNEWDVDEEEHWIFLSAQLDIEADTVG